jgi:hypothetical protein
MLRSRFRTGNQPQLRQNEFWLHGRQNFLKEMLCAFHAVPRPGFIFQSENAGEIVIEHDSYDSILLSSTTTPVLMLECRVEQCEHCLPVAFGGSGIIDWRIPEHPAVFRLIGLDPVIDAGLSQGLL